MEPIKKYDVVQVIKGAEDMALIGLVVNIGRNNLQCWCRAPHTDGSKGFLFTVNKLSVAKIGRAKLRPTRLDTPHTPAAPPVQHAPPPPKLPEEIAKKAEEIAKKIVPDELSAPAVHEIPKPLAPNANRDQGQKEKTKETTEREAQRETIRPKGKIQRPGRRKVSIQVEGKDKQQNLPSPENPVSGV